jgi:hypothetical protein
MARNDDKNGSNNSSKTDDKEMFDTLFREELDIQKKGGQGQARPEADTEVSEAKKEHSEWPEQHELSETLALSTAERRILKIKPGLGAENDTVKKFEAEEDQELEELIDTSPIWRYKDDDVEDVEPETDAKPAKRSHRLRTALLALLLLALGAFAINYFGIVDLRKFMPLSEWRPTPVVKHRVVRKPVTPPISVERDPTQPPTPETPIQEPVAVRETPEPVSSTAPETPAEEPVARSEQPEPMPSTPGLAPEKAPPETASMKEPALDIQPPKWVEGVYPFSVYLGSFRTLERLQKAETTYASMGLSPYWVQVDLGEKGNWFRLFAGFFSTRREADAFIRENHMAGAFSRRTTYAVLIGTYKSEEELNTERTELGAMGCSSYEVKDTNGVSWLFTGAFYQVARAQKHRADLAAKGIRGEVVER